MTGSLNQVLARFQLPPGLILYTSEIYRTASFVSFIETLNPFSEILIYILTLTETIKSKCGIEHQRRKHIEK